MNKIKQQIESTKETNPNVVNIVPWLSRLALDVIGTGLFYPFISFIYNLYHLFTAAAAYEFEAIEGGQSNRLAKIYGDLSYFAFLFFLIATATIEQLNIFGDTGFPRSLNVPISI